MYNLIIRNLNLQVSVTYCPILYEKIKKSTCKSSDKHTNIFVIDRQINVLPLVYSRRADADDLPLHIQQRAAGTAVGDRRGKLDHIHRINIPETGNDPVGNGVEHPKRTADRDHLLSPYKLLASIERQRSQTAVDPDHCKV